MANISIPFTISGVRIVKEVIERLKDEYDFDNPTDDYKRGVNDCFDAMLSALNGLGDEQKEDEHQDNEQVNHPAHYNIPGRKECIEEMIDKWGREFVAVWCEITAFKYEYRAGEKNGNSEEQDMSKRQWYLDKANELRQAERNALKVPIDTSLVNDVSPYAATGRTRRLYR